MGNMLDNLTYMPPRNKKELDNLFLDIMQNDIQIISVDNYFDSKKYTIMLDGNMFEIVAHCCRIYDNGFPNNIRPEVKRIQIRPIKENIITENNRCYLLCGLVYYANEPIIVVWTPFTFKGFNTNRSAYVNYSSIKYAYDNGFYQGCDCETNIYACKKGFFKEMLTNYIENTKFEEIKW